MHRQRRHVDRSKLALLLTIMCAIAGLGLSGVRSKTAGDANSAPTPLQTPTPAAAFREGCLSCHTEIEPMHETKTGKLEEGLDGQKLSCAFCHGGNPAERTDKERAHVQPRYPDEWKRNNQRTSSNPERTNTLLARESRAFVRFINPGDLRIADQTCGSCHQTETGAVSNSMMRHGAMLWGAALYNNGGYPLKDTRFGESYADETGAPERLIQRGEIKPEQMILRGILPYLDPLPRWEISQPGNILRVFERGSGSR
jgi:hypothetical protein